MKTGTRFVVGGVVLVAAAGLWSIASYYFRSAQHRPVEERMLDSLPVTGTPRLTDITTGPTGALCGRITGVLGGQRIGGAPGSADVQIAAMTSAQRRRFVIVPNVPAFYVEGLAPWALSLDGKKIPTDLADLAKERQGFVEQYQLAAATDGIGQPRANQEIDIKTLDEHFDVSWSSYCANGA